MKLPLEYRWLKAHDFKLFTPWCLIDPMDSDGLRQEYKSETGKDILPFARRQDNDDLAGFEIIDSVVQSKVITVHLPWTGKREREGWPRTKNSTDLLNCLNEVAIPDTRDWMTEEELEDLEK
ncbi:hypothetical protein HUW51_11360 [Adhaeribacter swui]|uniref:Uncharacterized protein n=1 Tax=Adhaeribacter swui TaxID=2086471 RepID=A0A7G7G812_9BACT|nr:hypothetical protein [Adhaeribacter swui]QNF33296.1 hypothetical protein HUW51_11360 [Adhaeribacter swui]